MDDATKDLIGFNEAAYRKVNEAIEAGAKHSGPGAAFAVRCECGSIGCNRLIELTVAEYEAVRASPRRFVLLHGHEIPEVETVVERFDDYLVVEKDPETAHIAERTDPRS
jgi:hypothetical protein